MRSSYTTAQLWDSLKLNAARMCENYERYIRHRHDPDAAEWWKQFLHGRHAFTYYRDELEQRGQKVYERHALDFDLQYISHVWDVVMKASK